jgi:hypothetical protein
VNRFCTKKRCPKSSFYYWKRRLSALASKPPLSFAPVTVMQDSPKFDCPHDMEIRFPGGGRVSIHRDVPSQTVAILLTSLRGLLQ